jgi:hypothetical protein
VSGLYAGEIPRRVLTPDEARAVVVQAVAERNASAAEFTRVARASHAARLLDEARALEKLLTNDDDVDDGTAGARECSS